MMDEDQAVELIESTGALRTGHFRLTSGRHAGMYIDSDLFCAHTCVVTNLCAQLSHAVAAWTLPNAVIAPAIGGVAISQRIAGQLSTITGENILALYAKKSPAGLFVLPPAYQRIVNGKNVLAVDDTITTGGSLIGTINAVRQSNGTCIGAVAIWNRGNVSAACLDVPFLVSLINQEIRTWDANECPLCRYGMPFSNDS